MVLKLAIHVIIRLIFCAVKAVEEPNTRGVSFNSTQASFFDWTCIFPLTTISWGTWLFFLGYNQRQSVTSWPRSWQWEQKFRSYS